MKKVTLFEEEFLFHDARANRYVSELESILRFRKWDAEKKEIESIDWDNLVLNQENFLLETEFTPSHWERVEYDWHRWRDEFFSPSRSFWFSVIINGKKYQLKAKADFTFDDGKWTEFFGQTGRDFSDAEVKDIVKNVLLNGRDDRESDLLYYRAWAWLKQNADKEAK